MTLDLLRFQFWKISDLISGGPTQRSVRTLAHGSSKTDWHGVAIETNVCRIRTIRPDGSDIVLKLIDHEQVPTPLPDGADHFDICRRKGCAKLSRQPSQISRLIPSGRETEVDLIL